MPPSLRSHPCTQHRVQALTADPSRRLSASWGLLGTLLPPPTQGHPRALISLPAFPAQHPPLPWVPIPHPSLCRGVPRGTVVHLSPLPSP